MAIAAGRVGHGESRHLPGVTVVVADDHVGTRAGVRGALEPYGMRVVAEAETAGEAVRVAADHRPDVCLIALPLPGNGIDAARRIRDSVPEAKIVVLTTSDRDDDLFAALRAGVDGYLLMDTPSERLPHALRGVLNGEAALPRRLTTSLIREFRERRRPHRLPVSVAGAGVELTPREFEVLTLLRKQRSTGQIAVQLQISDVTVRRHISAVLRKLRVSDRQRALDLLDRVEASDPD